MPQIQVRISKDGSEVTVEGQHFNGPQCHDGLGERIMEAIGTVTEKKMKAEYYQTENAHVKLGQ